MKLNNLNRRDFAKLTAAAVGGVVAGTVVNDLTEANEGSHLDESPLTSGKNVCRGLNPKCGGHKGGSNKCAGQGSCHTANKHTCHGANDCKGEGGCGERPGENACKGKGECGVPLSDSAWTRARANFEAAMKASDKKFGGAPAG